MNMFSHLMFYKRLILIVALLPTYLCLLSQQVQRVPKAIAVHIPKGYQVLHTAFGNLNLDKVGDAIVVLKSPQEDTATDMEHPVRRPLLILLGSKNGNYTLGFRNDKTVYCNSCGGVMGDPFNAVTIKNGYFTVEHYGGSSWRWTHYITFKFNPADKRFYLHRTDYSSFHASAPKKVEKKVETSKNFGTVDFVDYDAKYDE